LSVTATATGRRSFNGDRSTVIQYSRGEGSVRLYEFEAKAMLQSAGIPISHGRLIRRSEPIPADLPPEPWVVKSQVLAGGRMKAGGIRFASDHTELHDAIEALWEHPIHGLKPTALLLESRASVVEEWYVGVTYDQLSRQPLLVVTSGGGIDVEEGSAPVGQIHLPVLEPVADYMPRQALLQAGLSSAQLPVLTRILMGLIKTFFQHDLLLAEINPLARLADGSWVALDAHVEVDEDAVTRQTRRLQALGIVGEHRQLRPPTPFEQDAAAIDAADHRGVAGRVIQFDGDLGLLIGGGGASLAAFDAIRRHGGRPANYCEIGGNPSVAKVANLTRLILSQPGVSRIAVIMNVVNNTRADLVARGVIKGILGAGRMPKDALAVFRIPGAGEDEAIKLLRFWGVEPCGRNVTIDQAAARAVAAAAPPKEGVGA
jgi:succinyl-CoA synthetase beta subunit